MARLMPSGTRESLYRLEFMHRNPGVVVSTFIGVSLLLAGCGSQQAQVTAPTSAPEPAQPAASAPAVPTVPPVGAASASPAVSSSPSVALPAGAVRLTIGNDGTEARFRALE